MRRGRCAGPVGAFSSRICARGAPLAQGAAAVRACPNVRTLRPHCGKGGKMRRPCRRPCRIRGQLQGLRRGRGGAGCALARRPGAALRSPRPPSPPPLPGDSNARRRRARREAGFAFRPHGASSGARRAAPRHTTPRPTPPPRRPDAGIQAAVQQAAAVFYTAARHAAVWRPPSAGNPWGPLEVACRTPGRCMGWTASSA